MAGIKKISRKYRKSSPKCLMCGKCFMSSAQLEHHITEAVRLCKPPTHPLSIAEREFLAEGR